MRATDLIAVRRLTGVTWVFTSSIWQTTCTAHLGAGGVVLVDSLVLPTELALLPDLVAEVTGEDGGTAPGEVGGDGHGTAMPALLTTHGDWDHLFARVAFPEAELHCMRSTRLRVEREETETDREIATFFGGFYLDPVTIPLGGLGEMDDRSDVRGHRLRAVATPGHSSDGGAYLFADDGVLQVGDYLSPVEIPRVRESIPHYRATLERLAGLMEDAAWVVPGHGHPMDRVETAAVWEEDLTYLDHLVRHGPEAQLPTGRDNPGQRAVHVEMNVPRVDGGPMTTSDIASLFPADNGD